MEQTEYDFILSGSLLGVELKNIKSFPVGYLDTIKMYPLDFEEYAAASGIPDTITADVRSSFLTGRPVPDFIHDRFIKLFYEYLVIGGMPEVVSTFLDTLYRKMQNRLENQ